MKLIEARTTAKRQVVWIQDLEFNEVLEYDTVPFVEPKTGAIIIAADGNYEGAYHNINTIPYDDLKPRIVWAVEVIGTPSQVQQLLDLYWPEANSNQINRSQVWDENGIDRVIAHVQEKKHRDLNEQVSRILEARYHRNKTVDEVYDLYVSFMNDGQKKYGPIVIVDIQWWDDSEYESGCSAVMMLWLLDSSIDDANEEIPKFMNEMNLPFTSFDVDPGVLEPVSTFKHTRLHATVKYEGACPSEVKEARYYQPKQTTAISRKQVLELYKQHKTDIGVKAHPQIQVQEKKMWPRETTEGEPSIIPLISLWYSSDSVIDGRDAKEKAITYMRENKLPYTSVRSGERFGMSLYQVVFQFGERKDLTVNLGEARYKDNRSVEDVHKEYERIERKIADLNTEGYRYYDSEETGRVTHPHVSIDTNYNPSPTAEFGFMIHHCDNQQQADERLYAFIRKFNIPYNDIEYGQDTGDGKFAYILQYR